MPAGLNIGDCCACALTVAAHGKLLFNGTDTVFAFSLA